VRPISGSPDRTTRATRAAANAAACAVLAYAVLWVLSTQVAAIRAISPFADDPWDVVASYAAIFLPVVAGATWIRSLRHRDAVLPDATARRIRWGSGLAAAIVLVAAGVDAEAIAATGFPAAAGIGAAALTGLVAASGLLAILALVLDVRAAAIRPDRTTFSTAEPDIVDDALALATDVAGLVGIRRPVERLAAAIEAFLDGSPLSPRRHRLAFGVVVALAAAVAFDVWHALREGPWIDATVPLIFGLLIAAGVLAAYLGTVVPLRLLRPPR
jgi:hypothetical protein